MSQLASPSPDASNYIEQAWEIVRSTEKIVGVDDLCPAKPRQDARAADTALTVARRLLGRRLELTSPSEMSRDRACLTALAMRAEQTQIALKEARLSAQGHQVENAQTAINGLRSATSAAALVERIPTEVYRMGFSRVLFSRIHNGMWLTCSAFAGADEVMASAMVETGLAHPRQLTTPLLESEMVRRGAPILVTNPQSDPHVHPELIALTRTAAYVAAPVFSWGKPIGLLHADRHTDAAGVTEFDRDILGTFAAGLGLAFERNLMIDRLRAMRRSAEEHLRLAGSLADDFVADAIESVAVWPISGDDLLGRDDTPRPPLRDSRISDLTPREGEVLRSIAAGKTNAQIAAALFVSEGTVKSHVKHILRKLGASNRTEAVAMFHRAR